MAALLCGGFGSLFSRMRTTQRTVHITLSASLQHACTVTRRTRGAWGKQHFEAAERVQLLDETFACKVEIEMPDTLMYCEREERGEGSILHLL